MQKTSDPIVKLKSIANTIKGVNAHTHRCGPVHPLVQQSLENLQREESRLRLLIQSLELPSG